ncbi:DUF4199 domain-containing protein [Alistipes sp. OttesenSCG-928-B03]|nr:DUF4199 domain-containing protein [Alistipes sp. OttesenSCG-928-B03]
MENLAKRTFWRDAAKSGLAIGLMVVFLDYLSVLFAQPGGRLATVLSILGIAAMAYFMYLFSRRRSELSGDAGYSFGQAMGFIMAMMLFAGFVWGLGYYFLYNFIKPELLAELVDKAVGIVEETRNYGLLEQTEKMGYALYGNVIFMTFSGIVRMVILGSILGLFVTPFVKRLPEVAAPNDNEDTEDEQ